MLIHNIVSKYFYISKQENWEKFLTFTIQNGKTITQWYKKINKAKLSKLSTDSGLYH